MVRSAVGRMALQCLRMSVRLHGRNLEKGFAVEVTWWRR